MSFRKKIIIGAFIVLAAVLLVWSAEVFIANDSSVNNGTLIEKPYNNTLPEKPDRMPVSESEIRYDCSDGDVPSDQSKPISEPESRYVWAADAGASPIFSLTPINFDGFYYDLDNNAGSELFSIKIGNPADRTIKENDWIYSTTAWNVPFKYMPFGDYSVIGFMGERYLAGYTANSSISRSPVNLLTHWLLSQILIDENVNRTITTGSGLPLSDGYAIGVNDVNIAAGTAMISLDKDGNEIDSRLVKAGNTYIYEKDIRTVRTVNGNLYYKYLTVGNLPIIAVHLDSVHASGKAAAVSIKGIFQLSDTYTMIEIDPEFGRYGIMKITNISDTGMSMTNVISSSLRYPYVWRTFPSKDVMYELYSTEVVDGIKLKVADSDILRFYINNEAMRYTNDERRGAVYTESNPVLAWDGLNFPGFWYDLDSGYYSEKLEITNLSGRSIPACDLRYIAFVKEINYSVTKITGRTPNGTNGSYKVIGFGGNKYAAIKGNSSRLAKILIDNGTDYYEKKSLYDGETWEMGEGYNLTVKSIDTRASPRRAQLVLSKNGAELDEKWLSQGSAYTYIGNNSSEENDLPVFVTYLDAVFSGEFAPDFIQMQYTWLVSDNVTEIKKGDRLGVFSVTRVKPDFIILKNDRAINLSAGNRVNLIGNLSFTVADSADLRFYPSR
jgi:S-layer protein (TIGR01567 family)